MNTESNAALKRSFLDFLDPDVSVSHASSVLHCFVECGLSFLVTRRVFCDPSLCRSLGVAVVPLHALGAAFRPLHFWVKSGWLGIGRSCHVAFKWADDELKQCTIVFPSLCRGLLSSDLG